ncbi:MAG: CYTH domain-containing protein [Flavobacteriaceae bacterium]|jgi:CYTH domain-containing protein
MNLEIERKFLITNTNFKKESYQKKYIQQGFLNSDKNRVVRVRIIEEKAYLTIKGVSDKSGTSRFEWEKEISVQEAKALMNLCEKGVIEKYRYFHKLDNHIFEIDEFLGDNEGLIIAEVELKNKNEVFIKPSYLGKEVTGDEKYYNSNLSKIPFKDWA